MASYDFKLLSDYDFELLTRDLLQKELGLRLENFKRGKDKGIDLRYSKSPLNNLIVQCKHYASSSFSCLLRDSKKELPKVKKLSPSRYIFVTSLFLTPDQKDKLFNLFSPCVLSVGDIIDGENLNNLLGVFKEVENKNYKLWLTSTNVLQRILNSKIFNKSELTKKQIEKKLRVYVESESFFKAIKILEETRYCIISGIPGVGKTTLAEMLLVKYLDLGYEIIEIDSDIDDAFKILDQETKRIFYYDDFLGVTTLENKLGKNEENRLLKFIQAVSNSQNNKLILTTREYILKKAKEVYERLETSGFDKRKCIIDVEEYTTTIRAHILFNHVYFSELPMDYKWKLILEKRYWEIISNKNYNPRIIEWMSDYLKVKKEFNVTADDYANHFLEALNNPEKLWSHPFSQLSKPAQTLSILLTTTGGGIGIDELRPGFEEYYEFLSKKQNFPIGYNDFELALKELEESFIRIENNDGLIIVDFYNPGIKDYIENYIKEKEEIIHDILQTCFDFKQIRLLWALINKNNSLENVSNLLMKLEKPFFNAVKKTIGYQNVNVDLKTAIRLQSVTDMFCLMREPESREMFEGLLHSYYLKIIEDFSEGSYSVYLKILEIMKKHCYMNNYRELYSNDFKLWLDEYKKENSGKITPYKMYVEYEKALGDVPLEKLESITSEFKNLLKNKTDDWIQELQYEEIESIVGDLNEIATALEVDIESYVEELEYEAQRQRNDLKIDDSGNEDLWMEEMREREKVKEDIDEMFDALILERNEDNASL